MVPENESVPAPFLVTVPVPDITPAYVRASERSIISAALLAMLPVMLPPVPPAPTLRVPALIVVPPLLVLAPESVSAPAPVLVKAPLPAIMPP